jgi:two-component system, LytTR family, sensor histidine kinase AlgZ
MQGVPGPAAGQREQQSGEFFIPDLCSPRSVFVMILLAELMVLVYTLAVSALPSFNWDLLASSSLFVQWVVLLSAAILCQLRQPFSRLSLQVATAGSLLVVLLVTGLSSWFAQTFYISLPRSSEGVWWLLRNLLVAVVLSGIVLRYFYLQQQVKLRERGELQARLDSLRAKIRPHFLFNTLNSIASLIDSRPAQAEQAVEDLAELFRASLQDNHGNSTVADELHLCRLYLGIEQLRLGDRLSLDWSVDAALEEAPMPGLLLQPLVENAVYHGVAQIPDGGTIRIVVRREGEHLQVTIENPVPVTAGHTSGNHMALVNIEQRLQGLFGDNGSLATSRDASGFRVVLQYPLEQAS